MAQDSLKIETDFSKFLKTFNVMRQVTSHNMQYVAQKQMHNLSLELYTQFRTIAPEKSRIMQVPKEQKYRIGIFRSAGSSISSGKLVKRLFGKAKTNTPAALRRLRGMRNKANKVLGQRSDYRKATQGGIELKNARWIAIRNEIIKRAGSVGAAAGGWLAFYNKSFRSGDRLVPRNRKDTNSAYLSISKDKIEIQFVNQVKGIDAVNMTKGNLVQRAIDSRVSEMIKHMEEEQQKAIAQFNAT